MEIKKTNGEAEAGNFWLLAKEFMIHSITDDRQKEESPPHVDNPINNK